MMPPEKLSSQQAAESAADQRAADRTAHRATDGFAEIGDHPAYHLVGDRAGDAARDKLAGRQSSARDISTEDGPDNCADLAENSPARSRCVGRRRGSGQTLLQQLIGGFAIDGGVVFALDRAVIHDRLAFLWRDRSNPAGRRTDHDALNHRRGAVTFQEGDQRFPLAQFGDDLGGLELRIWPERLRGGGNRLLVTRAARGCPIVRAPYRARRSDFASPNKPRRPSSVSAERPVRSYRAAPLAHR